MSADLFSQLNNTYICDHVTHSEMGGCNVNGSIECTAQFGGLFDEDASTTWTFRHSSASSAVPDVPENSSINPSHDKDLWGADTFTVGAQASLDQFIMGVSRGEGETMNTVGLGRNSTLLHRLFENGTISSET